MDLTRIIRADLRQAELEDIPRLRAFYKRHSSAALPAPTNREIGSAIDEGRVLLIERSSEQEILAAAAIFGFSPPNWRTYVGEVSGTRVTGELGGYGALNVQRILLAARVLGHIALNSYVAPDASSTLVTVVKANNAVSLANVRGAGFVPMTHTPEWMVYDEHAWHGSPVGTEWLYFHADDGTARQAFNDLEGIGLLSGSADLSRTNHHTKEKEVLRLRSLLTDLTLSIDDLRVVCAGNGPLGLSPPPAELAR